MDETGEIGIRYLGVARQATFADVVDENGWKIRSRGHRSFPNTYEKINAFTFPTPQAGADIALWRYNQDEYKESFCSASTWNQLRSKKERVTWRKLVWFSQAVSHHSFMAWLTFRNRLSTGDRMRLWGITQGCTLCGEVNETREHLYFACPFSFMIWLNTAGQLIGEGITPDWDDTIVSLLQPGRTRLDSILVRMAFQTVVYTIWRERNSRRHRGNWVTVEMLTRTIDKQIQNLISSLCYTMGHPLEGLLRRWFEVSS